MSTRLTRYEEVREHRILHKVKKNWVVLAVASFAVMGAAASLPQTSQLFSSNMIVAHADDTFNYFINASSYPSDGTYDESNTGGIPAGLFTLNFPMDVTINVDGKEYQHVYKTFTLHRKAFVKTEDGVKKVYWTAYTQDNSDANVINNAVNNDSSTTWGHQQALSHFGDYCWLNGIVYQLPLTSDQVSFDSTTANVTMQGTPLNSSSTGQAYQDGSETVNGNYFFNSSIIYADKLNTSTPFKTIDGNLVADVPVNDSAVNVYGSSYLGTGSNDQFTINYKSKTQTTTEHKTVKRTINYLDANGQAIAGQKSTEQSISYHREVTKNLFTGEETKGDWVADDASQSELPAVTVPSEIDNRYTNPKVNGQSVSSIADEKPTLDDESEQDETVNVVYSDNASKDSNKTNGSNGSNNANGSDNTNGSKSSDNSSTNSNASDKTNAATRTNDTTQSTVNHSTASTQSATTPLPSTGKNGVAGFGLMASVSAGLAGLAFFLTKKNQ